jgi:thioesterase domain-containing protein
VIVPIRPQGKSAPLFLVQSYLLYNAMLEIIEPDRPIYGVREMGDEREPMAMSDRARKFAQEIVAVYPSGPLYLAGWCAAGSLTVEIARQLREGGHEVGLVALFDAERPGFTLPKGVKPWTVRAWKKTVFHARRLQRIPWNEKVTYITDAFGRNWDWAVESYYTANYRTMLWLQRRFGVSLSEAAFNAVYATMSDHTDISVRPYPGKLNLFRAADVPDFAEMDATLGWSVIAEGGVDVNFVPGDHVSMFKKPYNVSLAQRLQRELQASEAAIVQA